MTERAALRALADRVGILPEYVDQTGRERRITSDETRERILSALGFDASTESAAQAALEGLPDEPSMPMVRPVDAAGWSGSAASRDAMPIVVPDRCLSTRDLGVDRPFGIVANLYTVRSERNWGAGDLADLARLAKIAGSWGGDFVGINPLHAIRNRAGEISPYGPVSRLFRNPLYLAVDRVPDLVTSEEARSLLGNIHTTSEIDRLRAGDMLEYERVMAVKRPILEALHRAFIGRIRVDARRRAAYDRYRRAHDPELTQFATWSALDEHFRSQGIEGGWPAWPERFRRPTSPAVREFAAGHDAEIDFHRWLQFELDQQVAAAATAATKAGLRIGIYQDLAIGALGGGADSWMFPDLFVQQVALGAPPDEYARQGQNWGLPPLNPRALRATRFAYWRALLRSALEHAGALRIDHILGLFRQFWIPNGVPGSEGAYVRFPTEEMLGLLALESRRARALVVGEDLGTVPPEVGPTLARWGIYSSKVMYFEREGDDGFKRSATYPSTALATADTHDMAPIAGFWTGDDIEQRVRAGHLDPSEVETQRQRRVREKRALVDRLAEEGTLAARDGEPTVEEVVAGVHRFLCRSPAELVGLSLDDLVAETSFVNLPGVPLDKYPSWQRRLRMSLEAIERSDQVRGALGCRRGRGGRDEPEQESPARAARARGHTPRAPLATYRLQIHHAFPLADATGLVPYLARLGVTHAYSSPLLQARTGSVHGYDVVDPTRIDPQVGDDESFAVFVRALHESGLGLLLDIVPNHMALGRHNPYWWDVLAYGLGSPYAKWFDVDWEVGSGALRGRVVLPGLGEPIDDALRDGKLKLVLENGSVRVAYGGERFPLDPATLADVLAHRLDEIRARAGHADHHTAELDEIMDDLASLPRRWEVDDASVHERRDRAESALERLAILVRESPAARQHLEIAVADFATGPDGVDRMRTLLGLQVYHLSYWREGLRRLNYRRFFDITDLIGVRVADPEVFDATHERILQWVRRGDLDGVRIDHIDGLRDPAGYLRRLDRGIRAPRSAASPFILVEKILSGDERLRETWPVAGTTGYDFLNDVESVFVSAAGRDALDRHYARLAGGRVTKPDFDAIALECKRRVLVTSLNPDVERVLRLLSRVAPAAALAIEEREEAPLDTAVPSPDVLRATIIAVAAALPVYRTYFGGDGPHPADIERLDGAIAIARRRMRMPRHALDIVRHVLVGSPVSSAEASTNDVWREFAERFQQLTGPAAAKGVEDTALYRHVPLASLCEVGGTPNRTLSDAVPRFHRTNEHRAIRWPMTMLATTTHDTKRSADVRSRLDVLSEIPERWIEATRAWRRRHRSLSTRIDRRTAPDAVTEYLLYQSVLGIWPLGEGDDERVQAYMLKAMREGKSRTSWLDPNESFERALRGFVEGVLADDGFRDEMDAIARDVIPAGRWNALARTILHLGSPGIPDLYQGDEMWNHALVDPDNRRPVDYTLRESALAEIERASGTSASLRLAEDLVRHPADGRIKLLVVHRALQARRAHPTLFVGGAYHACRAAGAAADHVVAFERVAGAARALIVAPRFSWTLSRGGPPVGRCWRDTTVTVDEARDWRCAVTGRVMQSGRTIRLADALGVFPVGMFISTPAAAHR